MKRNALAVLLLGSASTALAQVPAGPELRVNTYTTGSQALGGIALDPQGRFVVVWASSGQDGSGTGVFAQRYSDRGAALGTEFQVNTYTTFSQGQAEVATGPDGRFMVVWTGTGVAGDTDGTVIAAQRFDTTGNRLGGEFRVNDYTTSFQEYPSIAPGRRGEFVVAWHSVQDGDPFGIVGRRFDAAGSRLGDEFQVNSYSTNSQAAPSVASPRDGPLVVAWQSFLQDGSSFGIFGQLYDVAGARLGGEFQVNTYTTLTQSSASAARASDGTFVVTWDGDDPDGSYLGVFAQRFAPSGARLGAEFRVDGETQFIATFPSVAAAADGSFVIVWEAVGGPGDPDIGVFGRRFTAAGAARGAEFRVNTYVTGFQAEPRIVSDPHGNFVVAWRSRYQDGSVYGTFAQRFGGLRPTALAVDGSGNRVLEPGETVAVAPSWLNFSGAAHSFAGTLSGITGPPGATYTIDDGAGSYGTVADGATAGCSDCYAVSVSNPPTRPATHWDASATERIVPDVQGQQVGWLLHVGRSFTDVPTTNLYYRFVETLLHRSVTGGCGGGAYCAADSTTRAQMAAFTLLGKEGAGYVPPACTTPLFGDVPADHPFCRWIEELARRGVVSGCGGGNYCPLAAVTREQMAVFVLRTLDPSLEPAPCVPPNRFDDVPETSVFCRWIEELAARGVVTGCAADLYCPAAPITREQMAVFITVTFGLTLYGV